MLRYLLSKLMTFVPTFIGVTLISFVFIRALPGDPIIVMAGERGITSPNAMTNCAPSSDLISRSISSSGIT